MKILILNGANLNFIGIREPEHYGKTGYIDLCRKLSDYCAQKGADAVFFQSNHEGALIDRIHEAYHTGIAGIVFNPGAFTHTSIALADAIRATKIPTVEVHISKVEEREDFRQTSFIRPLALATITGHGTQGYFEAVDLLLEKAGLTKDDTK